VRPAPRTLPALACALLAACSSSPNNPPSRPEGGAPDGAHDGADAVVDMAPETGVDAQDAPAEAGGLCGRIPLAQMATFTLHLPDGGMLSCANATDAGAQPPRTFTGLVTSSDATSIVIDTCGQDARDAAADDAATDAGGDGGCAAGPLRVDVSAAGLDLSRFPHVRVRVRAAVTVFYQCQRALEITTADDAPGDAGAAPVLLFAVNDGGDPLVDAPYGVAHAPLGCSPVPVCNGAGHNADEYALIFSDAADITNRVRVYMGDTASWVLGASSYTIRNLRSFQSPACDDYWNWAYWIYADQK
jgi:hypothetical protein